MLVNLTLISQNFDLGCIIIDENRPKSFTESSRNWVLNEANTLESSSILIYSELHIGLYTQRLGLDATFIKE